MKINNIAFTSALIILMLAASNKSAYSMQLSFNAIVQEAGSTCSCKQSQAKLKAQKDLFKISYKQIKKELESRKDGLADYKQLKDALRLEKTSVKNAYIKAKQQIAAKELR